MPTKIDATERLLNLVIALLGTQRGHSKKYLRANINGYAPEASTGTEEATLLQSFERMFERDKATLQDLGIPISQSGPDGSDMHEQVLYRINPEEYRVPEIRLDEAAMSLLSVAANLWAEATLGAAAQSALRKIASRAGTGWYDDDSTSRSRIRTAEPSFEPLWSALRHHHPVTFSYRRSGATESTTRTVAPWGLGNKYGQWYLSAFDTDKQAVRNFRLSRITSDVHIHATESFERPATFAIAPVLDTLGTGNELTARIAIPTGTAHWLRSRSGTTAVQEPSWRRDGWDVVQLSYRESELMADDVASMGAQALVLAPAELRDAVANRLRAAAAAATATLEHTEWKKPLAGPPAKKKDSRDRLIRLLSMVPYLVANPGVDESEVLAEFGITAKQWAKDMDTLNVTGLPGYFHGDLMDVTNEAGQIFIRDAETLASPLRLSQEEACSVMVGLKALSAVPGTAQAHALEAAMASLAAVAGRDAWLANAVGLEIISGTETQTIAALQAAIEDARACKITYLVRSRDELTNRTIEPFKLFSVDAAWYVRAWCRESGALRSFRVESIKTWHDAGAQLGAPSTLGAGETGNGLYHPTADDVQVDLVADALTARRLAPAYDAKLFDVGEGRVGLRLLVGRTSILPALMARLGGHAAVAAPETARLESAAWLMAAADSYDAYGLTVKDVPSLDG
ncbi:hypothetical protein ART_0662 [Arthrobacter sp. PAMC 25486]|uniref:helix-turn-helix transcriptional regulator n=1 Tax=Arthrobacter sp. PAMC 25486 TaxID=1494608 RepID=UPI00053628EB|nr:WYL domain-containing protein [Arthrobacter sp. PAMC 25486]AIY00261.1 hypothetical protein ART_0662 [Arthrobacter sp. PAMC 25486]